MRKEDQKTAETGREYTHRWYATGTADRSPKTQKGTYVKKSALFVNRNGLKIKVNYCQLLRVVVKMKKKKESRYISSDILAADQLQLQSIALGHDHFLAVLAVLGDSVKGHYFDVFVEAVMHSIEVFNFLLSTLLVLGICGRSDPKRLLRLSCQVQQCVDWNAGREVWLFPWIATEELTKS